ncbi:ketopantoate reductase family protein [Paraburkholderia lycopersici]|uniref:2-dehydropantoate 2-reductase n=1 Tax=Paraburkholderia lycopersici TaxID=416944 RepID=A0A1G6TRG7_9BURK|nr:2-dehydropantoate 2-reductase [Paraburkholderia lycopersici]SDD31693.1 2-dehydropantoate 2-reductase [Paraburkholderia lycopersici]
MKLALFGAGAVGGYLASRLIAGGGHDVSIIARGAHLAAIRASGLTILSGTERSVTHPAAATDTPADLPAQDIVFVTLKAFAQADAAEAIAALRGAAGWVVFVANGIPWWWRHGTGSRGPLPLVDPGARLWNTVRPEHVLGCVVYSANEIAAPGVIRHSGQNRWIAGEPDGTLTGRLQTTVSLLAHTGLAAEACTDLRREIWMKVSRNVPLNVVCALTRLPIDALRGVPGLENLCLQLADEVAAIARACGMQIGDAPARIRAALANGGAPADAPPWRGIKPSMLQDVLHRAPLETEAIVGQVRQIGEEAGVPCPAITTVLALLRGLALAPRLEDADADSLT